MRVAYNNIIDTLSSASIIASSADANFPVTNIQDQRLTMQWLTDTASTQNVVFTLDTFPILPDSSAGTIFTSEFNSTTESFVGTRCVVTAGSTIGYLTMNATSATSAISKALTSQVNTGTSIIFSINSPSGLATTCSIFRTGDSTAISIITGIATTFTIVNVVSDRIITTAQTIAFYANNTASSGTVFNFDNMYVGNGSYTTTLPDNSGNGNNATVVAAIPKLLSQGLRLSFNGSTSYMTSNKYLSGTKRTYSIKIIPYTLVTADLISINKSLLRLTSTNIRYYADTDLAADIDVAHSFSINTEYHLVIVQDENTVYYYKNGILITTNASASSIDNTNTNTLQIAKSIAGGWFDGAVDEVKVYNRALSSSEVLSLYNNESFVGENYGLIVDWTLNKNYKVNSCAILGHNIKSGTPVKVEANDQNEWGLPALSETFSYVASSETILKFLSSTYSYKYWKFSFTGQSSIQIGRIWLGEYLTIDPSSLLDFKVIKKRSDTVIHGKNRQKWANEGIGWRRFELSFPRTEENMVFEINKLYDEVGNHSSFIFCNFDTIRDYILVEPCYVSIDGEISFTHTHRLGWIYGLNFEEEK